MMEVSFTRLVWKDALLVRSLLYIAASMIVVANLAIAVSHHLNPIGFPDWDSFAGAVWMLIPCLVAFGAPAMLIGTEQESGTLAWLRTLPITRYNVIYSKLLVALLSLALTWALSSIALFGFNFDIWQLQNKRQGFDFFGPLACIYFSVALLLAGFVTSYLFRSPIASLAAVLPAMFSVYVCGVVVVVFFEYILIAYSIRDQHIWIVILVAAGLLIGVLILFVVLHHVLALRRLRPAFKLKREDSPRFALLNMVHFSTARDDSVYRLNLQLRLPRLRLDRVIPKQNFLTRPNPLRALLWQAASQQAVPVITIMVLAIISWLYSKLVNEGSLSTEKVLLSVMNYFGMSVLGSLVFYSDTIQQRRLFFAERGLSRSLVWFTRMTIPATVLLIITILNWQVEPYRSITFLRFLPVLAFTVGALISLAAARPVLGLIATPVLLMFLWACLSSLFQGYRYSNNWPSPLLAAIVALYATWRLFPRWLMGRRGIGFDLRVAGYLMLGVLVAYVYAFGHRWSTIPAALPEWRTEMLSMKSSEQEVNNWSSTDYTQAKEYLDRAVKTSDLDLQMLACVKMLDATRLARETIVKGQLEPRLLFQSIETDEAAALQSLSYVLNGPLEKQYLLPAIPSLASDSLRRQSRQVAIVDEWKKYQSQAWRDERTPDSPYAPKTFLDQQTGLYNIGYSFERLRTDRFVDAATKATLEYLDRDASKASSSEAEQLRWLWVNVDDTHREPPFSVESDRLVSRVRERMEVVNQSDANGQRTATDAVDLPPSIGEDKPAEPLTDELSQ